MARITPLSGDRAFDQLYSVHYYCPGNERYWAHTNFRLQIPTWGGVTDEWTLNELNLDKSQAGYRLMNNHGCAIKEVKKP